jgi:hypothetical protein
MSKIAKRYKTPIAIQAARMRLATLILSMVADTKDMNEMQAIALQEMSKSEQV